jgi:hypothetical protein
MDCAYIGDSIAVGLEQLDTNCALYARVGASSEFITRNYRNADAEDYVVISMGSNDPNNPQLLENAERLRRSITARKVIWILPYNRVAAGDIAIVAREFRDSVVDLRPIPSRDGLHPDYRRVNRAIRSKL